MKEENGVEREVLEKVKHEVEKVCKLDGEEGERENMIEYWLRRMLRRNKSSRRT